MEKMYATNPGLRLLMQLPSYHNYTSTVSFDAYAIDCIRESGEAVRARSDNNFKNTRPAFSI